MIGKGRDAPGWRVTLVLLGRGGACSSRFLGKSPALLVGTGVPRLPKANSQGPFAVKFTVPGRGELCSPAGDRRSPLRRRLEYAARLPKANAHGHILGKGEETISDAEVLIGEGERTISDAEVSSSLPAPEGRAPPSISLALAKVKFHLSPHHIGSDAPRELACARRGVRAVFSLFFPRRKYLRRP